MSEEIKDFTLKLHPPYSVFYPEQKVVGEVTLETCAVMNIEKIIVQLVGKGTCHWQDSRGIGKNQRTMVDRIGKENIVKLSETVFDALEADNYVTRSFQPGVYQYQFKLELPKDLPSSFEGKFGNIRYVLKARISRPGKDDIVKLPISVNELIDTNDIQYSTDEHGAVHEDTGFLCFRGWLDFKARLSRNCYCPGDPIYINANVINRTGTNMNNLCVKLIQKVIYRAKKHTKEVEKVVASLEGPKVPKKADITWKDQPFGIPGTQPSIKNSKVINVRYVLKVYIEVPIGDEPAINLNIKIGTVPYLGTYGKEVTYGTREDPKGRPKVNIDDADIPPVRPELIGYPNMHPPILSSAVDEKKVSIGQDKDFNTYGDLFYIPVYTFAREYEGTYTWPEEPEEPEEQSGSNSQLIPVQPAPGSAEDLAAEDPSTVDAHQ